MEVGNVDVAKLLCVQVFHLIKVESSDWLQSGILKQKHNYSSFISKKGVLPLAKAVKSLPE